MPGISVVPPPNVYYTRDVCWPDWANRWADGSAFVASGAFSNGAGSAAFWNAVTGAGGNNMQMRGGATGEGGGYFASSGAGAVVLRTTAYKAYIPLLRTNYTTNFLAPTISRVWRMQWIMWEDTNANFLYSFCGLCPEAGVEAADPQGGACFFGIAGNSDGTWRWVSRNVPGAAFQESVPLNLDATTSYLFDIVIRPADALSDASMQLFVNNQPVLGRSWGAGSVLPNYSNPVNATHFTPMIGARDPAIAARLVLNHMRICEGQFMPDGTQL